MRIPLSSPDITESDIEAVVSVLRTPTLSIGPRILEFEGLIADYVGVPHGIALSSGTAGLHLCLRALDVHEGDEVIIPSFTFIAVGNVVLSERATPVFVDIDPLTLNLDPAKIEARITSRTRAIIVVHTFGYPADLNPIMQLAAKHGLAVIEDACEALGAEYQGRRVGGIADFGVFGFYPNKPITTAEGGMVVTRHADMADKIRALRNQGRRATDGWTDHALLGYNYRLSEINCALGVAQMKKFAGILEGRERVAMTYSRELESIPELDAPLSQIEGGRLCWFVYVVRLRAGYTQAARDSVWKSLLDQGIGCGRYFAPLHLQPLFASYVDHQDDLSVTEDMAGRTLALPFFNHLTEGQVMEVCSALKRSIAALCS
jgi:perosamine synthetase